MSQKKTVKKDPCGYVRVLVLLNCEDTIHHDLCGWCHDFTKFRKRKGVRVGDYAKNKGLAEPDETPMHGTHKVPYRCVRFVYDNLDTAKKQASKQAYKHIVTYNCEGKPVPVKKSSEYVSISKR